MLVHSMVLRLPYYKHTHVIFSMYFLLPDALNGLPLLISFDPGFVDRHVPHKKVTVGKFMIPKFKIRFNFEASRVLKEHGLVLPFSSGGLNEMVKDGGELYASGIFQKAFIQAAAVSVAHLGEMNPPLCAMNPPKKVEEEEEEEESIDFVANHPFMFVVREDIDQWDGHLHYWPHVRH